MVKKKLINKGRVVIDYTDEDTQVTMTPMLYDRKLANILLSVRNSVEGKKYGRMPAPKGRGAKPQRNRRIQIRQG